MPNRTELNELYSAAHELKQVKAQLKNTLSNLRVVNATVARVCSERDALRAKLKALDENSAPLETIQWRNIRRVVDALADFCFGSQDDPRWGVAHIAIRTSLTAKDGLDTSTLGLEKLYAAAGAAPVPCVVLTHGERAAFNRFYETWEDGEGYDVPKEMMKRLSEVGVIHHISAGRYDITKFGHSVLAAAPRSAS